MIHCHDERSAPKGLVSPDIYFTPAYGGVDASEANATWVLLEMFDGGWLIPLAVRSLANGLKDATSPYGYSGVYAAETLSDRDLVTAWRETTRALSDLRVVSVFLRHSPLVEQAPRTASQVSVVEDHPTTAVDVGPDERMWERMEGRSRTAVRKALKAGYTNVVRAVAGEDLVEGSPFRTLYESTMARREAAPSYTFSDGYYTKLRAALGPNLAISEVISPEGTTHAAALLMRHGRFLHYHLSGSQVEAARLGVNNLLLWGALKYAGTIGVTQFHLGGGVRGEDALFKFKRAFGGRRFTYSATGLVVDEAAYDDLVGRSRGSAAPKVDSRHFPAYRAGG